MTAGVRCDAIHKVALTALRAAPSPASRVRPETSPSALHQLGSAYMYQPTTKEKQP